MATDRELVPDSAGGGGYLQKHFPLAFQSVERLMVEHGAPKRDGDDTEWRKHHAPHHVDHAVEHTNAYRGGEDFDPDSTMPQLTHVACRSLMALEVYLRGNT